MSLRLFLQGVWSGCMSMCLLSLFSLISSFWTWPTATCWSGCKPAWICCHIFFACLSHPITTISLQSTALFTHRKLYPAAAWGVLSRRYHVCLRHSASLLPGIDFCFTEANWGSLYSVEGLGTYNWKPEENNWIPLMMKGRSDLLHCEMHTT